MQMSEGNVSVSVIEGDVSAQVTHVHEGVRVHVMEGDVSSRGRC